MSITDTTGDTYLSNVQSLLSIEFMFFLHWFGLAKVKKIYALIKKI